MKHLIIGFVLGIIAGSGTTYYICKKKAEKDKEEYRAATRKELKEYYERKEEEEDAAKITHVKVIPDKPVSRDVEEYRELVKQYDPAELERPTEEDLIEESEAIERVHTTLEQTHERVKLINIDNFGEIQSYDTESLTYYVQDQTLVHEDGTVVDDEAFLIGDALDRYGWRDDDENEDALYCRNYKLQKDYEVIKVMDEYTPE
jgi:hypothetical protein